MRKIIVCLIITLFFIGCQSSTKKKAELRRISAHHLHIGVCNIGCAHLATLVEEGDDQQVCREGRPYWNMTCVEVCSYKLDGGDQIIDPLCWSTLTKCDDFEEQCNFGEVYP